MLVDSIIAAAEIATQLAEVQARINAFTNADPTHFKVTVTIDAVDSVLDFAGQNGPPMLQAAQAIRAQSLIALGVLADQLEAQLANLGITVTTT